LIELMNVSRTLNVASYFLLIVAFGALTITCKRNPSTVAAALDGGTGTDAPNSLDGPDDVRMTSDGPASGSTCSQPGAPLAALTDVCSMSGTICGAGGASCPLPLTNWDMDVGLLPTLPSDSDVPSCSLLDEEPVPPGWQLKVEKILPPQLHPNTTDHYDTRIVASRVRNGAMCSVTIAMELRGESFVLPLGSTIQYIQKNTIRNPEADVSLTTTIRDVDGKLILAYVGGTRPEVWDSDVLPELSIALTPVCARTPDITALRVSLSSGTETCVLEDSTARCCSIGGRTFQVEAALARRYRTRLPSDTATMLIAQSGTIVPAR
jgi:hypothetical protein